MDAKSRRHALIFVTTTVLIDVIGFGIIMPVLPQLLMELTDGQISTASSWGGYLLFSYAVLQFFFAPALGNLSDRYGRRPVLLLSLFFYGVNYLLAGLATSLWLLFLGRLLTGITSATYSTANALIADVSAPEEKAQNFGLLGMAFGVGFVFGPTLGGLLGEWDIRAPFYAAAILAFCNTLYGYVALRETLPVESRRPFDWSRANPVGALRRIGRYPMLVGMLTAVFAHNIAHHVYPSNWSFYTMEKFAWSAFDIGLSMGLVGILMALVQGGLIRVVVPRIGAPRSAILGFASASVAYIGIAFAPNELSVYLWCFVSALAGFVMPAVQSIMSNQVPPSEQGELQGIVASVGSVGMIIGPLLMTQTFAYFTSAEAVVYFPGAAFLVAGALALLALAVFVANVRSFDSAPTAEES